MEECGQTLYPTETESKGEKEREGGGRERGERGREREKREIGRAHV